MSKTFITHYLKVGVELKKQHLHTLLFKLYKYCFFFLNEKKGIIFAHKIFLHFFLK